VTNASEFVYERPTLYPKQEAAIFHDKRWGLIEASTKAGKTVACIVWITEQALQGKLGYNYWWVAPSYNQAKIAYTRLCQTITGGIIHKNETDLTVTMSSGAVIWFKSGELPDKLYGEDVYAAIIDEASRVREAAWHALRSTLTATRGPARIIGNVKGRKNWFFAMARTAEREMQEYPNETNMHYAKIVARDAIAAGVLDAAEVEDARRHLPEQVFKELYEAEAADDGGNPFGESHIRNCYMPLSLGPAVCWGWDVAKSNDWTVGIGLDKHGRCCEFHRWHAPWRETIKRILSISGKVPSLVDSTGVGDALLEFLQLEAPETMRGFKFTSVSKQQLMEALAIAIQSQEIAYPGIDQLYNLPPNSPYNIPKELYSFEYEYTRTGVRYAAAQGEHDDCVCALALAWKLYRKPTEPNWMQTAKTWRPGVLNIFGR